MLTQHEILLGRWRAPGQGSPGERRAMWLAVLGFTVHVVSFPSCLRANHLACAHIWSHSRLFLVARTSLCQMIS